MGNLNNEKPRKVAFCVSTLAIIWTSLLVFVVAVVLAIVALFLVFSYRDESITSQAALQNATTRDHQSLQVQLDIAYSEIQALQLQLNNSNSLIVNLQSQLLNTSQETRRIVSNLYEDLQYQLNNTAHFLQSKLNNASDSLQSRIVGVSLSVDNLALQLNATNLGTQSQIGNISQDIQCVQSELNNVNRSLQSQLNQEISMLHSSDQLLQTQINKHNGDIETLKTDLNHSTQVLQTQLNTNVQSLESQLSQSNQDIQSLQSQLRESNEEFRSQLNSSVLDHRMQLLNSNQDIQALFINYTKIIQMQQNLSNLEIQALQLSLNNVDTEIATLQLQLQNSSQETQRILLLQLNQEISNLNTLDQNLQTQINSNIGDIHTLKIDLNNSKHILQTQLNSNVWSLESQLSQSNQDIQSLQSQLGESNMQLLNSNQEIHLLTNSTQVIQAQVTSNDLEIQTLQSEIADLSQECPGLNSSQPATSCQQVLNCNASSPSGSYWIQLEDGSTTQRYCNMNRACGGKAGGWMRVAMLDMRESSNQCPSGLRERAHQSGPRRLCGINIDNSGCSEVHFATNVAYDQVCGKIIAYQFGSPDAFGLNTQNSESINGLYVEGISLTYSLNPRKHIWTFAAALDEVHTTPTCPCVNIQFAASSVSPPDFIGNDYFCDTGSTSAFNNNFLYADDPLWDGAGCGPANTCCSLNNPPWFFRQLSSSTSEDIDMRVCANQDRVDEDVRIQQIEIYVR